MRRPNEVHALVCPACAAVLESYRTLGRPEGLEALASFARRLDAVVEQRVRVGGLTLIFELLPREREQLTARALLERLGALYGAAFTDDVVPHIRFYRGRTRIPPAAHVRDTVRVVLAPGAPVSARRLAATIRIAARSIGR